VQVDGGIFALELPDLLWETEKTGTDRFGYPLPTGEGGVPRWGVVCDPYLLWKLVRKRLSDRQSRHMVTLSPILLGEQGVVHLHSLVADLVRPQWLFDVSRVMDDGPPILLAE
jgi:hypothetical protein